MPSAAIYPLPSSEPATDLGGVGGGGAIWSFLTVGGIGGGGGGGWGGSWVACAEWTFTRMLSVA